MLFKLVSRYLSLWIKAIEGEKGRVWRGTTIITKEGTT